MLMLGLKYEQLIAILSWRSFIIHLLTNYILWSCQCIVKLKSFYIILYWSNRKLAFQKVYFLKCGTCGNGMTVFVVYFRMQIETTQNMYSLSVIIDGVCGSELFICELCGQVSNCCLHVSV